MCDSHRIVGASLMPKKVAASDTHMANNKEITWQLEDRKEVKDDNQANSKKGIMESEEHID